MDPCCGHKTVDLPSTLRAHASCVLEVFEAFTNRWIIHVDGVFGG